MIEEKFDVRVHKTYPLKDVARAHEVSHENNFLDITIVRMDC